MCGLLRAAVAVLAWSVAAGAPLREIVYVGGEYDPIKNFQLLIPILVKEETRALATPPPVRDYLVAPGADRDERTAAPGVYLQDGTFSDIPAHEFVLDSGGGSVQEAATFRGLEAPPPARCDASSCYICCVLQVEELRELLARLARRPAPSLADRVRYHARAARY